MTKKLSTLIFILGALLGLLGNSLPPTNAITSYEEELNILIIPESPLFIYNVDGKEKLDVREYLKHPFLFYNASKDPLKLNNFVYWDIKYQSDEITNPEILDSFQFPFQTFHKKTGDCDDQAILLYSCLVSEGYEAYLIIGSTENDLHNYNHAWVSVVINNKEYFLDPTRLFNKTLEHYGREKFKGWVPIYRINDEISIRYVYY